MFYSLQGELKDQMNELKSYMEALQAENVRYLKSTINFLSFVLSNRPWRENIKIDLYVAIREGYF